jgi:hypothetical protein
MQGQVFEAYDAMMSGAACAFLVDFRVDSVMAAPP